jgi:hypothetical protein
MTPAPDWPSLPDHSVVLHEHADPRCPSRAVLYGQNGCYGLVVLCKYTDHDAPPLTREQVEAMAHKMLAFVGAS